MGINNCSASVAIREAVACWRAPMRVKAVVRSTSVSKYPQPFAPSTTSISQFPNRVFWATKSGRLSIDVRLGIRPGASDLDLRCLRCLRGCRRYSHKFRSEEHTSELQSRFDLVCRLLLEQKTT